MHLFIDKIRPRAVCGPPQGRVDLRSVCGLPFQHAPFPRSRSVFAIFFFFSRRIPSWIPPFPPCRPIFGHLLATVRTLLVESGSLIFRCVFWACFLMIFDAFFAHFWDDFYMFFAYLFEQCFCLLFPRTFFKCMHTFKTRDLQNTLFFSSKNAILEEPPLQTTYEKMHFLGWNRTLFFA